MARIYEDMNNPRDQVDWLSTDNAVLRQENSVLWKKVNELTETLKFAAQYRGVEGRGCPLCTYDNGRFIKLCQMHEDMEAMRLQLIGLRAEYDDCVSANSALVLESQNRGPSAENDPRVTPIAISTVRRIRTLIIDRVSHFGRTTADRDVEEWLDLVEAVENSKNSPLTK